MKTFLTFLPSVLVAAALGSVYGHRALEERQLLETEAAMPYPSREKADSSSPHEGSDRPPAHPEPRVIPDKPLPSGDREIIPLSKAQGLELMSGILAKGLPPGNVIQEWELPEVAKKLFPALDPLSAEQLAALISVKPKPIDLTKNVMSDADKRNAIEPLLIREAARRLARQSAPVILRAFEGLDPLNLEGQSTLILDAVSALAKTDPDAAWSWVSRQPKNIWGVSARNAVLVSAASGDGLRWLALADHYAAGPQVLLTGGPTALEFPRFRDAWISRIVETRGQEAAQDLRKFAVKLHDAKGFEAARDFVDSHPSLPEREALIRSVASSNLSAGGASKADWLVKVSSPETVAASTGEFIKSWTAKDPAGAAVWLNAAPSTAIWRDPALKAFSTAIAPHDAEAARSFAAQITNSALRDETLRAMNPTLASSPSK